MSSVSDLGGESNPQRKFNPDVINVDAWIQSMLLFSEPECLKRLLLTLNYSPLLFSRGKVSCMVL